MIKRNKNKQTIGYGLNHIRPHVNHNLAQILIGPLDMCKQTKRAGTRRKNNNVNQVI